MKKYTSKEIEILMKDGNSRKAAENCLKNGTIVYEDLERHFEQYKREWNEIDDEFSADVLKMIKTQKPMRDWSIVRFGGKTYYIEYVS